MKKILFILSTGLLLSANMLAQTTPAETPKQEEFDKKFRFGIRATPQPCWLKSNNTNSTGDGAIFGFGFGLMLDVKLSKVVHFSTGLGGDFEGGYVKYKIVSDLVNPTNNFAVNVVMDKENNLVEAKDGLKPEEYNAVSGSTSYTLQSRKYKSTFITIPVMLKMMTQEYSGLKYFFNFGGEIGIRAGVKANDTYAVGDKAVYSGTLMTLERTNGPITVENINVGKDASLLPFRVGMNLGFGTEYRLGGSTSLVTSINYFQSFTNLMRNDSKFLTKDVEKPYDPSKGYQFTPFNQGYFARAIRINIGIMF